MHAEPRRGRRTAKSSGVERILALRGFPGYAGMSAEDLAPVAAHARERVYAPGTLLFRRGEEVRTIYFVLRGRVALVQDGEIERHLGDRSVLGALPAFARAPFRYDALVEEETVALEMAFEDSVEILEDNFRLLRAFLRGMAGATREARMALGGRAGFSNTLAPQPPPHDRPLDLVERMWALRSAMTFVATHIDAIADMARDASEVRLGAGEVAVVEGARDDRALVVVSGALACTSKAHRQAFVFGPGDGVGFVDAMAEAPRWYGAEVTHDLVALRLSVDTILDVFEDHFDVALDLLAGMSRGIMQLQAELPRRPP